MKTLLRLVVLCLAVPAGVVLAQDKATQEKPMVSQENPLSTWNKFAYAAEVAGEDAGGKLHF